MITYCLIYDNMIILNFTERLHIIYFFIMSLYYYGSPFGCSKPKNWYAIIYLSVKGLAFVFMQIVINLLFADFSIQYLVSIFSSFIRVACCYFWIIIKLFLYLVVMLFGSINYLFHLTIDISCWFMFFFILILFPFHLFWFLSIIRLVLAFIHGFLISAYFIIRVNFFMY
jgi:hypothetical protein